MASILAEFFGNAQRYVKDLAKRTPRYNKKIAVTTPKGAIVEVADEAAIEVVESEHNLFARSNNNKGASNDPHDIIQYRYLNNELHIEEFTSIVKCTKHGLKRLMERFTVQELKSVLHNPNWIKIQNDGAKVMIKKTGTRYAVVAFNETSGELITALNKIDKKALLHLSENYRWSLNGTEI